MEMFILHPGYIFERESIEHILILYDNVKPEVKIDPKEIQYRIC